jgi:hypothetical protein
MNNTHDEHDDDLEPEVIEGAEIETENYDEAEDVEESPPGSDVTNRPGPAEEGRTPADADEEEHEGEANDTI